MKLNVHSDHIAVTLNGELVRAWIYHTNDELRRFMTNAQDYVDGFNAGLKKAYGMKPEETTS